MSAPIPFTIDIPEAALQDLRERLLKSRLPEPLEDVGWSYGTEYEYLKELAHYWATSFDWRKQEAYLNSFPQFKLLVNGIDLHFVHLRSAEPNAIPLILSHGWPGTFFEFHKMFEALAAPKPTVDGSKPQAFHVVAPSLPGYGFSSAPRRPGFGVGKIAETFDALMSALGYQTYVAQGGDWGSAITSTLARKYPERCRAIHINLVFAGPCWSNPLHLLQMANMLPGLRRFPVFLSRDEMKAVDDGAHFQEHETGYSKIQGTKPQTLGYALNDSPAGLLAWIVEKFHTWADTRGEGVESAFVRDEVLTNVAIYWLTGSITSSTRLYHEAMHSGEVRRISASYCKVPTGVAVFPKEIFRAPRSWASAVYNIQQWSVFPRGGHFAALEAPAELTADVRKFFAAHH
ncbi:hypothetical protein WJX81_002954 [Elliptochloris bilobata]|uniref:Epoxide hydrolase N-terminal domain-containing protein n=1 Tax=Elliptochloris bilobata TaxID=381761 RepID=A0AAW1RHX1_9CHLO